MPGEAVWWLRWPFGGLGGRLVVLPPAGRVESTKKTTAGAPGQAGQKQADQPPVATWSARRCSDARAHIPRRSRITGIARRRPRNSRASRERSSRNPHPQQQARPLVRLRAHARCGVRNGEARRLSRRVHAGRSYRRHTHAASEGAAGGRRGTISTTTPPACVRACGLACASSDRNDRPRVV